MTENDAPTTARVAVTGATGFIGAHVVRSLLDLGAHVTAAHRNEAKLHGQEWRSRVTPLAIDLKAPEPEQLDHLAGHDCVAHLAWGHLDDFRSEAHIQEELPLHLHFLRSLVERGAKRLLVAGTCLEYGMQSGALAEDLPTAPVTAYGKAKDLLRRELEPLCARTGTRLTWARLFYLHGPGQAAKALLSQLDRAIMNKAEVFNMSGGMQLRDYLPVQEAARLLARLALAEHSAGIVNVGSGRPVSVLTLVEEHLRRRGSTIRLNLGHYPYPDYEPMEFWADTERLAAILQDSRGSAGFRP